MYYSQLGYGYKINHDNIIPLYLFLFLLFPSFSAATGSSSCSSSQDTFTVLLKLLPVTLAHKTHNQLLALLIKNVGFKPTSSLGPRPQTTALRVLLEVIYKLKSGGRDYPPSCGNQ